MEILRVGEKPGERTFQGTCERCNSVLRARENELRETDQHQRGPMRLLGKCPVCDFPHVHFDKQVKDGVVVYPVQSVRFVQNNRGDKS